MIKWRTTKSILTRYFILFIFIISFHSIATAQYDDAINKSRALIKSFMELSGAPGIAVSVGIKNQIVWSEGFGFADLEQSVPVQPAITRFRIGSVSKPFTTVAVSQLFEQGKLDLDAPVQKYVPEFPKKKKGEITTRLLTGHLAGIRHYRAFEFYSKRYFPTVIEGLDIFEDDTLLFVPGTRYSYSSYG